MYVNQIFRALLAFKCSIFFSDPMCVCNFPQEAFDSRCFSFKPCVTHLNTTTYSKAYTTVKGLTKRVDKCFK